MENKEKNLGRNVRFNLKIANYRPGQVVRYGDMPDGHRFWVDNKSILGAGRICEFTDEKPESVSKPEAVKTVDISILETSLSDCIAENKKLWERIAELETSESDLKDKLAELNKTAADPDSEQANKIPDFTDFTTEEEKKTDITTETKRGRGRPSTKTNENK